MEVVGQVRQALVSESSERCLCVRACVCICVCVCTCKIVLASLQHEVSCLLLKVFTSFCEAPSHHFFFTFHRVSKSKREGQGCLCCYQRDDLWIQAFLWHFPCSQDPGRRRRGCCLETVLVTEGGAQAPLLMHASTEKTA